MSNNKSDYNSKYYLSKKDTILEKAKERVICQECHLVYMKSNKTRHLNSKKHKFIVMEDKINKLSNS